MSAPEPPRVASGPPTTEFVAMWSPPTPARPRPLAGIALWLAIAALGVSLVVGWGIPIALLAIAAGIASLRRPGDRRGMAVWALGLAGLSLLYSAAWLLWALPRL